MQQFLLSNLKRLTNLVEYPALLSTANKDLHREFVRTLLFIQNVLGKTPRTLLDIGASKGEWSRAARFMFPDAFVYAFEPIPAMVERLKPLELGDPKLRVFNLALSNRNEVAQFQLNDFSYSSSLLPMTETLGEVFPETRNFKNIDVECRRLDALTDLTLEGPVMAKLDVQGAELMVLEGFGDLIARVDVMLLEVNFEPLYEKQPTFTQLWEFLNARGFAYFLQTNPKIVDHKLIYCDFIFFR